MNQKLMHFFPNPMWFLIGVFSFFCVTSISAQELTKVKGTIIDKQTKEPLAFVNVAFIGTTVGTTTDADGQYLLQTQWASEQLQVSFLGYKTDTVFVKLGTNQVINFELESASEILETVTVSSKKNRYRKKNNPAVGLIKKVMENRDRNRLKGQNYYEYDKYEKVELDINNITDKFRERKVFENFQFMFDYVDTSEINGKPYLPVYMQETNSRVYYRKKPEKNREYREALKQSDIESFWDGKGIAAQMDVLYQEVDIYANQIFLIDVPFIGPLSPIAADFYRYYIIDTVEVNGKECIDLAFLPRNKQNFGFVGNIFVTNDTNYTIIKVDLGISDRINMNWITDLKITQEFSLADSVWIISKDEIVIDFAINKKKGLGFFGRKAVVYKNHIFNKPRADSIYNAPAKIVDAEDLFEKDEDYWQMARPIPLTINEQAVYDMVDSLQTIPAFQTTVDLIELLVTGYYTLGPVDIGPAASILTFNSVQGARLRVGGETNFNFNKKNKIAASLTYIINDQDFRYSLAFTHSFNEDYFEFPKHEIRIAYNYDSNFPGQQIGFANDENFLLSFKRGVVDKMIDFKSIRVNYLREFYSHFSYDLIFESISQKAIGNWEFGYNNGTEDAVLESINTTEVGLNLRWAPNEEFIQGRDFRSAIFNKYPILTLNLGVGIKDLLGGNYSYQRATFRFFKKFHFSLLGYAHIAIEGGKTFGEGIPYPILFIPRANQTYAFLSYSYNMMNFLEFAYDQYTSVTVRYFFNGFIFNKIPLLKRLKLREAVSFKMLYGKMSDVNNPNLHPELVQFPTDINGNPTTFLLGAEPYMEVSAGVENIFKVLNISFVKRLDYLNNPNIPELFGIKGLGLRFLIAVEF
jgi:hypothetical protein